MSVARNVKSASRTIMQQEMSLPGGVAGRHGPPSLLSPARHSPPGNGDARTSETVGVNHEVTRKSTLRKHPSASPRRDHRISGSAASEGCLSPGTSDRPRGPPCGSGGRGPGWGTRTRRSGTVSRTAGFSPPGSLFHPFVSRCPEVSSGSFAEAPVHFGHGSDSDAFSSRGTAQKVP